MSKKYFKNKNAIITGAASGIGREFAISLARMGCNLVISDINLERLELLGKELQQYGIKVVLLECDVSKQLHTKKLSKTAISEFKDIHFVFSNAGIATGGPLEHLTMMQYEKIININILGMINVVKAFIPKLVEQGYGHIIVTASIAGTIGIGGLSPYNTTKFANAGFCESLYGEFAPKGIDVSILSPFPLSTNLIESVGIGIPPELLEGIDPVKMNEAIKVAKVHYWKEFTKKHSILKGFAGGFTVERAVKRYLKKIKKKKLYIYERRYGRFMQLLKGLWPGMYKRFIKSFGKRHMSLFEDTFDIALKIAKG